MGCINDEIGGVNIVAFYSGLKEFWMVYHSFLHEAQELVLLSTAFLGEVVQFARQLVFELAFFVQEIGVVSAVEVLLVLRQRVELVGLDPGS